MTRQELEALRDLYPPDTICIPGLIDSHLQALDDLAEQAQEIERLRKDRDWIAQHQGKALRDQRDRLAAAVREMSLYITHKDVKHRHAAAIEEAKEVE